MVVYLIFLFSQLLEDDLNKQYFKTRSTHKKNLKRWNWILRIGMFMVVIIYIGVLNAENNK